MTLSVDQYASTNDAAAAYQTAVQGSKAAPGFKPAASPKLGQEAFVGTSQVAAEMHFGLWARDGRLIVAVETVIGEPVSASRFPVKRENKGDFADTGPRNGTRVHFPRHKASGCGEIP